MWGPQFRGCHCLGSYWYAVEEPRYFSIFVNLSETVVLRIIDHEIHFVLNGHLSDLIDVWNQHCQVLPLRQGKMRFKNSPAVHCNETE